MVAIPLMPPQQARIRALQAQTVEEPGEEDVEDKGKFVISAGGRDGVEGGWGMQLQAPASSFGEGTQKSGRVMTGGCRGGYCVSRWAGQNEGGKRRGEKGKGRKEIGRWRGGEERKNWRDWRERERLQELTSCPPQANVTTSAK